MILPRRRSFLARAIDSLALWILSRAIAYDRRRALHRAVVRRRAVRRARLTPGPNLPGRLPPTDRERRYLRAGGYFRTR